MNAPIDEFAELLGYLGDPGFVSAEKFSHQPNHRHALRLAAQQMGVRAAFGLWTGREGALRGPDHPRFTPLVYLAEASDANDAQRIHRSIWSQGLVPFALIVSGDNAWLCEGFAYSSANWEQHATEVSKTPNVSRPLHSILARTLRSSIAWRDEAKVADEFVDERLLQSLAELSIAFSKATPTRRALEPAATNALVARLLYFYFLVDRRFITSERLETWGLREIRLEGDQDWTLKSAKALFRRLDEVFNGSIFPMPVEHADAFDAAHLNELRLVLRHGAELYSDGSLQSGFLDYDFASIRTETLSAIYEMFLRNEVEDAGQRFGAFYTPPYLADYVLDRLEDEVGLRSGVRVLDPAAGSGVFLVGAYRRIVEASLALGQTTLPLEELHDLMTKYVFGIELNSTACHVAAFSLYITMLDYVEPNEAADYTSWPVVSGRSRLFPPMLSDSQGRPANIRVGDFFSPVARDLVCDVIVGNPPWVQLPKLKSEWADTYYAKRLRSGAPIGDKQAAELFTWKAYEEHLSDGGALSLLLPLKSLVNAFSDGFTQALRENTKIVGIADFAHLRYALFRRGGARFAKISGSASPKNARQAAAGVLVRKGRPTTDQQFWSFRPLRPTQPASRNGRLWNLVHDWTQVHWHRQADVDGRAWRRVFTCSAIDRRMLEYIDRQISEQRVATLKRLQEDVGLEFRIEVDQNLDRKFVLSADRRSRNYWRSQLGLVDSLIPTRSAAVPLPKSQIRKSPDSSRPFVMGNVVLMPRTCEEAVFVEQPVAASFMVVACFPKLAGKPLPRAHKSFLQALAAYMSTRTFRYLCFVSGRRMTIDRANIELSSATSLPWPFKGLKDPCLAEFLGLSRKGREAMIGKMLGLSQRYQQVIREFSEFREDFSDGGTPAGAVREVSENELGLYRDMLLTEIDGGKGRYEISTIEIDQHHAAAIVRYVGHAVSRTAESNEGLLNAALSDYARRGASSITQSRYLWHSRGSMASVLIKPHERLLT